MLPSTLLISLSYVLVDDKILLAFFEGFVSAISCPFVIFLKDCGNLSSKVYDKGMLSVIC